MVLGNGPWIAFLHRITRPAAVFSSSSSDWHGIPSVMIFARTLGFAPFVSTLSHWTIAAIVAAIAMLIWWRTKDGAWRLAILAIATVLVTPYLRAYDLVLLVLPIATLISRARLTIIEKAVIFCGWIAPAILMFAPLRIQFGPVVSLALLIVVVRHFCSTEFQREIAV
jgi:hypothetical protein